ncbi:hypothetical protein [Paraburkholderia dilworthii]|uniref:hypothetical protein n=1 Tax=Paraburkholderia dilworthii TaxID=948106 RepID=UPI000482B054|nr:hypothetical protein [Paraburkholderia dilworthii]
MIDLYAESWESVLPRPARPRRTPSLRVDRWDAAVGITVFHPSQQIKLFNIMEYHNISRWRQLGAQSDGVDVVGQER